MNTITRKGVAINTGDRFGRLTIASEIDPHVYPSGQLRRQFQCECECGNVSNVTISRLRSGHTQSCGCIHRESLVNRNLKHGYSDRRIHDIWCGMIYRCSNQKASNYRYYGGKGVKVCDRWQGIDGFKNFLSDMGEIPIGKHSIDRINGDGNYEPSNCRWATNAEQSRNRPDNRWMTHRGKTQCLTDWAAECKMPRSVLWQRIKTGWGVERSLDTPYPSKKGMTSNLEYPPPPLPIS